MSASILDFFAPQTTSSRAGKSSPSAPGKGEGAARPPEGKKRPRDPATREGTWMWMADGGVWHEYSSAVQDRLEDALTRHAATCSVDGDRFVDLGAMVQRRQDDPGRKRPVRRVVGAGSPSESTSSSKKTTGQRNVPDAHGAPLQQQKQQKAEVLRTTWQWLDRQGVWNTFSGKVCDALESAFVKSCRDKQSDKSASRDKCVEVPVGNERVVVLNDMVLKSQGGSSQSKVRRVMLWFYCENEAAKTWKEYSVDQAVQIESAARQRKHEVQLSHGVVIDLVNMCQFNSQTSQCFYIQRGTTPPGSTVLPPSPDAQDGPANKSTMPPPSVAGHCTHCDDDDDDGYSTELDQDLVDMAMNARKQKTGLQQPQTDKLLIASEDTQYDEHLHEIAKGQSNRVSSLLSEETQMDSTLQALAKHSRKEPGDKKTVTSKQKTSVQLDEEYVTTDEEDDDGNGVGDDEKERLMRAGTVLLFSESKVGQSSSEDLTSLTSTTSDLKNCQDVQISSEKTLQLKRAQYACGDKYVELKDIPLWSEWLKQNASQLDLSLFPPRCKPSFALNNIVSLWQGDITTLEIDAVVNAAKASLMGGGGSLFFIHSVFSFLLSCHMCFFIFTKTLTSFCVFFPNS